MAKRKSLTKKIRFEVLKRDWFKCKYCWKTPDQWAKLQVDHIIPVAEWWWNEIENLTSACFECNIWKWKRMLSKKHTNRDLKKETKDMKEQVEILKEYYKYLKVKNELEYKKDSLEEFEKITWSKPSEYRATHVKKAIKKYGMELAMKAWGVFLEKDISEVPYFFWICKNLHLESSDKFYKQKNDFYYRYIYWYDIVTWYNYRGLVMWYDYRVLEYYVNHFWKEDDGWNFVYLYQKEAYMDAWRISEYAFCKAIMNDLRNRKEEILKSFNSWSEDV